MPIRIVAKQYAAALEADRMGVGDIVQDHLLCRLDGLNRRIQQAQRVVRAADRRGKFGRLEQSRLRRFGRQQLQTVVLRRATGRLQRCGDNRRCSENLANVFRATRFELAQQISVLQNTRRTSSMAIWPYKFDPAKVNPVGYGAPALLVGRVGLTGDVGSPLNSSGTLGSRSTVAPFGRRCDRKRV